MAVKRLSNSLISSSGRDKMSSFIAGYSPAVDEMDLIQRITVGLGGQASIQFTSIPQTYQHLQIRMIGRNTASVYISNIKIQINGDTNDSGYPRHLLYGDGATAGAAASAGDANGMYFQYLTGASSISNNFSTNIIDILDYANTSKYKTVRCLGGLDNNGQTGGGANFNAGYVYMSSGLWQNTNAITSINLIANFAQYSTASLYGVIV